jgi:hypothetical protein
MKYKLPIFPGRDGGKTNLNIINYNKIMNHIDTFDFFNDYKIVEYEQEHIFDIDGIPFISIPDLVAYDKKNNFVLFDHKVSNIWKNNELKNKKRQMYLYALAIYKKYNKLVNKIKINFFKENEIVEYEIINEEYKEMKEWVYIKVSEINNVIDIYDSGNYDNIEDIFTPRCKNKNNDFYAKHLCSHRNNCQFKKFK